MKRRSFLWLGGLATSGCALGVLPSCENGTAQTSPDAGLDDDAMSTADANVASCPSTEADALGPFFEEGAPMRAQIADANEPGQALQIFAQILETDCLAPIANVLVDIWQADAEGNYYDASDEYRLRGQVLSDSEGRFMVDTIRPGSYQQGQDLWRPAHVHFMFTKPGFETVATQLYFSGDPYLSPNDGCGSCGSDDPKRIVSLEQETAADPFLGQWQVFLART